MKKQDLVQEFISLNSNLQDFENTEDNDEIELLKVSLIATQKALNGLRENKQSIYKPWLLKCIEFMDYLQLHQAYSNKR